MTTSQATEPTTRPASANRQRLNRIRENLAALCRSRRNCTDECREAQDSLLNCLYNERTTESERLWILRALVRHPGGLIQGFTGVFSALAFKYIMRNLPVPLGGFHWSLLRGMSRVINSAVQARHGDYFDQSHRDWAKAFAAGR